jgi:hypothetical protein
MSRLSTNVDVNGTISYTGNTKVQQRAIYSGQITRAASTMPAIDATTWDFAILTNVSMPPGYTSTSNIVLQVCDGNYDGQNDIILSPFIVHNANGTFNANCVVFGITSAESCTINYVVYLMV